MEDRKRTGSSRPQSNSRNRKKKRMSYRRRIRMIQVGAVTFAVFLLLIVGAVILTKLFVGDSETTQQAIEQQKEEAQAEQKADDEHKQDTPEGDSQNTGDEKTGEGADEGDKKEAQSVSPDEQVQITISAVGDCTIGTDAFFDVQSNFDAFYIVKKDPGYFFQNVKSVLEADDLTIINMEGTLTESNDRQDKTYAFKGAPKYTEILTAGSVEAANMANNHSHDYGEQSYTDTIQYLEAAGITTFGYDRVALMDVKGVPVGLVGIYELSDGIDCQQELLNNIQAVKDQGAEIIIVAFHWGTEKEEYPDDIQKSLAHTAIDNGADLVLGHHPHVLQGIEVYNGKNIVYSLGNFCFGGNRNPADKDTMIFQQTFTVAGGALVEDNVTNIIPCSLSSVQQYNDYSPIILDGSEKDRVMAKIQERSAGLSAQ